MQGIEINITDILLFSVFFVPGFVYLKAYRLFFAETRTDFSKDFYEAIGVSFLNAIIFAWPLYKMHSEAFYEVYPIIYYPSIVFVLIIIPALEAFAFFFCSQKKWFSSILVSPVKGVWDPFFSKRESYYVIVTLKNGRKIAGKYGKDSYSSTYPHPKELYLQEVWKLNEKNGFEKIVPKTEGILISDNEISTIEFFI